MKNDQFKAFCVDEKGFYSQGVEIEGVENIFEFYKSHFKNHYEIKVVDEDDYIVFRAIEGSIIFPLPEEIEKMAKDKNVI